MSAYTKFYVLRAGTVLPNLTADWQGSWNLTASDNGPFLMDGTKYGSANTLVSRAESSATNPFDVALDKFITRQLAPQTISGTLDMVMAVRESSTTGDFYTRIYAYIYNATDDTVLGVLLDYAESAGGGGAEWTTTSTGTALQAPQTLASVVVPSDGKAYYLVIEFGYRAYNSSVGSISGQTQIGATSTTLTALADLTVGSTSTTTQAGYFVFSNAITVVDEAGPSFYTTDTMLVPGADGGTQGSPEVATILDTATGAVVGRWESVITAETGDNLPDGTWAIAGQASPGGNTIRFYIYDPAGVLVTSFLASTLAAGTWDAFSALRSDKNATFYTLQIALASPTNLRSFSATGTPIGSWTMPTSAGRGCSIMVPSRDGSIVYFGFRTGTTTGNGVGRFSTAGAGSELTPLIPTAAGLSIGRDLLCTIDGDVICIILLGGANAEVRRYADNGTLLATYPLPASSAFGDTVELSQNPSDEDTFWVRTYPTSTTTRFLQFRISDGATLTDYTLTSDDGTTTLIPLSCPFILYPSAATGTIIVIKDAGGDTTTVFDLVAGGGLSPFSFSLVGGGSQSFLGLPPDSSGYSIEEINLPAGWNPPSYNVSNGDPVTNISVGAGETVTVTVTNTQCPGERGDPRTDGLSYSPIVAAPCGGSGTRGAPRTGA